jgi:hypothetical protein
MSDQELSQFCDLLLAIRAARRAFLIAGFEPERWDNFADSVRSDFRAHRDNPGAILPSLIRRTSAFKMSLQIERARMLRALKVPGSDTAYHLDETQ